MTETAIKVWKGLTRQQDYASEGAQYAQNNRYWIEGEVQRRHGMTANTAQSGQSTTFFRHPLTGLFAIFYTTSGTLVAVSV